MKKVSTLLSVMLMMLMFLSCNNEKKKEQVKKDKYMGVVNPSLYKDLANDEKARSRLWKAAIDSGDCKAYSKIAVAYLMSYREVDLYYYSLIMANKYHCSDAYLMMYTILTHEASPSGEMTIISKDKDTKNLAFYYLLKAKELGSNEAQDLVELEFGKSKTVPNSSFFLKQLMNSSTGSVSN